MNAPAPKRRAGVGPAILSAVVVGVLGLIFLGVASFQSAGGASAVSGDTGLQDGIRVHANIVEVKPDQDEALVRLSFEPVGSFVLDQQFLSRPAHLVAVGADDVINEKFDAGEIMNAQDLRVGLGDGDIGEFPFDTYGAQIQVRLLSDSGSPIPSVLAGGGSVHGYRLTITGGMPESNKGNDLAIRIQRAPATLAFAIFIEIMMWMLTLLALAMALGEIRRGREIDGGAISFLGVLLFAFPAVRNSVPNVPSLGVLGDYVSFFWCEIGLGLGLVSLLFFKLRRTYLASHQQSAAATSPVAPPSNLTCQRPGVERVGHACLRSHGSDA